MNTRNIWLGAIAVGPSLQAGGSAMGDPPNQLQAELIPTMKVSGLDIGTFGLWEVQGAVKANQVILGAPRECDCCWITTKMEIF